MATPYDELFQAINRVGYHNHRRVEHSDTLSAAMLRDLRALCPAVAKDLDAGTVRPWLNEVGPHGRETDLMVGPARLDNPKAPDLKNVRMVVEHKSVVTAHRNRWARVQDLEGVARACHAANPSMIVVATVLVGTAARYLNVADRVLAACTHTGVDFQTVIRPRLQSGDEKLWDEFKGSVSRNSKKDSMATVTHFRSLPVRARAETHIVGLDFMLIIPVAIDNVNPPAVVDTLGIDAERDYQTMIQRLCDTYNTRWH